MFALTREPSIVVVKMAPDNPAYAIPVPTITSVSARTATSQILFISIPPMGLVDRNDVVWPPSPLSRCRCRDLAPSVLPRDTKDRRTGRSHQRLPAGLRSPRRATGGREP